MGERDGLHHEMRRLLPGELGSDPLAIDQDTADRLLAGRLDPADAPPGYAEVARVLAAAAAPVNPRELEADPVVMAAFARQRLDRLGAGSHSAPRRRSLASRLAVVAVAVGVLGVGGVAAAATGALPEPAKRLADSATHTAHHSQPKSPAKPSQVQVPARPSAPATSVGPGEAGSPRNSGHDRHLAGGNGHRGGRSAKDHKPVGPGSAGRGATGKARRSAHGASKAEPGGAQGSGRSTASQAATTPAAKGRAEGHRKEKGR